MTTQINIAGHPGNEVDGVVRSAGGLFERELSMADFKPIKGSKIGELAASFDIDPRPDPGRSGRVGTSGPGR